MDASTANKVLHVAFTVFCKRNQSTWTLCGPSPCCWLVSRSFYERTPRHTALEFIFRVRKACLTNSRAGESGLLWGSLHRFSAAWRRVVEDAFKFPYSARVCSNFVRPYQYIHSDECFIHLTSVPFTFVPLLQFVYMHKCLLVRAHVADGSKLSRYLDYLDINMNNFNFPTISWPITNVNLN